MANGHAIIIRDSGLFTIFNKNPIVFWNSDTSEARSPRCSGHKPAFLILLRRETWWGTALTAGAKRRCGAVRRREAKSTRTERSEVKRRETTRRVARRVTRGINAQNGFTAGRFTPNCMRTSCPRTIRAGAKQERAAVSRSRTGVRNAGQL